MLLRHCQSLVSASGPPGGNVRVATAPGAWHARAAGRQCGMASDDSRAQVQLDQDTLARRRRDLGEDHPDTLASADNLASSLRAAGSTRRPGSWAKTSWPAAASWARTTPTP